MSGHVNKWICTPWKSEFVEWDLEGLYFDKGKRKVKMSRYYLFPWIYVCIFREHVQKEHKKMLTVVDTLFKNMKILKTVTRHLKHSEKWLLANSIRYIFNSKFVFQQATAKVLAINWLEKDNSFSPLKCDISLDFFSAG